MALIVFGAASAPAEPQPPASAGAPPVQDEDPPTERELISRHVRTVRNPKLGLTEKLDALEELLELGTAGPARAAQEITLVLKKESKAFEKARARALKDVDKRASKLIKARLNRKAAAEVETTRAAMRRYSTSESLTKDEVKEHCDPAIETLRGLLRTDRAQVTGAHPEIGQALDALESRAADAALWTDYFKRAKAALGAGDKKAQSAAARLKLPWDAADAAAALQRDLTHTLWLASPMTESDRRTLTKNVELGRDLPPSEVEGNRRLNDIRLLAGLGACLTDPKLCAASRDHSKDMSELGFFSHTSPVDGKQSFGQRASNFGTSAHAENIAMGQTTPQAAIEGWWYSPGHHRNMMGAGHARVGLGRTANHWTQLFGG